MTSAGLPCERLIDLELSFYRVNFVPYTGFETNNEYEEPPAQRRDVACAAMFWAVVFRCRRWMAAIAASTLINQLEQPSRSVASGECIGTKTGGSGKLPSVAIGKEKREKKNKKTRGCETKSRHVRSEAGQSSKPVV